MLRMVDDLFPTRFALKRVPLADAEIYYLPELPLAQTAEALMKQLMVTRERITRTPAFTMTRCLGPIP
jgi:hypothetical protein